MSGTDEDPIRNETEIPPGRLVIPSEDELEWLERRRDVLQRAIAEMQSHRLAPQLSLTSSAELPDLLGWAQSELNRVQSCIDTLDQRRPASRT